MGDINFSKIEKKWQTKWEKEGVFEVKEDNKKEKYYVLEMYPYPSASGLHIGHAFNYTIGDIIARYKRMKGFNVLHPMGFDSFGLPAENAAIKLKRHPKTFTDEAISNFVRQQKALGLSYAWSRQIESHNVLYYGWNQLLFLEFYEKGLIYRKKAPVNWCSECNSVLANEQVIDGKCWRHKDLDVQIKNLEQWFIRTTKYADELLEKVDSLDWPERIKIMQRNWIGKSEGAEIDFEINGKTWKVFTTRPDTLYGVTFLVVSAQHPDLINLVSKDKKEEIESFVKKIKSTKNEDLDKLDKEGVFTGSYAQHPITGEKIPIWTGNFVLADYGSGMVMAVPAHDKRDFEFAKKYNLDIKEVVESKEGVLSEAYIGSGKLKNSGEFSGLNNEEAKEKIFSYLSKKKKGKQAINYRLKDWLVSRQRYWGTPIPMIYCDSCGIVPVPKKDLPVFLPEDVKFGEGNPLATSKKFLEAKCPKCSGKARRETDTMDTFFDSSWYYLRFTDPFNEKAPFSSKKAEYWMPVDFYTGGAEHACMHLIFARFFTKALRDLGYVKFDEPFKKLFNQGMVHGEDGVVMSKSRGNVVDPLEVASKYGADSLRLFLVSMASPEKDSMWSTTGMESTSRFVKKVYEYFSSLKFGKSDLKTKHKINLALKEVTQDIEELKYNLAVIRLRGLFDNLNQEIDKEDAKSIIKLISPFCPYLSEEIWAKLGNKKMIIFEKWPAFDESKIDMKIEEFEKNFEKSVSDILNVVKIVKEKQGKDAEKIYLYVLPNEKERYDEHLLTKRVGLEVKVYSVSDKSKYDPEGKSAKTKPGKPGIYIE